MDTENVRQAEELPASKAPKANEFNTELSEHSVQFIDGIRSQMSCPNGGCEGQRLHKEIKALKRGLPCDEFSSIFVGADSDDYSCMKIMIAGSAGTPYAHGLFEFDTSLPSNFPNGPPVMSHLTSLRSGVCFGPNLYGDGYVCLSIIGTWSGDEIESWSPNKNLLQVLISIQSLVMEDNIIAKEPGWEYYEEDSPDNIIFQNIVKIATIRHAMIAPLREQPPYFAQTISSYFKLKKHLIIETINQWLADALQQKTEYTQGDMAYGYNVNLYNEIESRGYHSVLYEAASELRELLISLYSENLPPLVTDITQKDIQESLKLVDAALQKVADSVQEANLAIEEALSNTENLEEKTELVRQSIEEAQIFVHEPIEAQSFVQESIEEADNFANEPQEIPCLFKQASSSDPQAPDSQHDYFKILSPFRFNIVDFSSESTFSLGSTPVSEKALSRLNKELKSLSRSLPCEPSGSIFVAIDNSNIGRLRALISGAEGTPYEHGLFLFDFMMPENYPINPPNVNLVTTGDGDIRFNPNLYDSGFVCLSVINTWDAEPESMWNPEYSTILQVLLSIQTLVMDEEVIQKEPGFEYYLKGDKANQDYCTIVKYGNIKYAMTKMITQPPEEFADVIQSYFRVKKEQILLKAAEWVREAEEIVIDGSEYLIYSHNPNVLSVFGEHTVYKAFQDAYAELEAAINTL